MSANWITQSTDKPEITTLVLRSRFPKRKKRMFCLHCGFMLMFTYKEVTTIIEGTADIAEIETEVQCKRCKALFEIC